jgi:D-glycero-D-manno-heptose 1,7-bisphosphate phosphatase
MRSRPAIFLDRDETLIHDPGFIHDPAQARLMPGVATGLKALAAAGWPLVVVSNQSGIARGLHGPEDFEKVMARARELLAPHGVAILAAYYCPHHPEVSGACECRKPGTLLYRRAASEHGLDLAGSWYLGDRWRDVAPALALGGRGLLVRGGEADAETQTAAAHGIARAGDMAVAADLILGQL